MGKYATTIQTKQENGKYYLYVEYFSYNQNDKQFYEKMDVLTNQEKENILRKNAKALLSLIDNLDGVRLVIQAQNEEIICQKEYTREQLESESGVDLRTYKYNPEQFF